MPTYTSFNSLFRDRHSYRNFWVFLQGSVV
jgi:hypothetical protein